MANQISEAGMQYDSRIRSGPPQMEGLKVEPRAIEGALATLKGHIAELGQTLSILEQRMNPYLLPENPSQIKEKDITQQTRAAVTTEIHDSAREISMAISYLHRLIGRID